MSEENKAIVRRLTEEVFNRHDPDAVERFFAPDYVEHVPAPGQGQGSEGMSGSSQMWSSPPFPTNTGP
jgi:predicted SnoaL-like aldol condensation-catalyzing enzyme